MAGVGTPGGSGPTVLVVDDDRGMAATLVEILTLAGLPAEAVHTPAAALARQAEQAPALAVVDYRLPGQTGLELATRLRAGDPDVAVVVLTGHAALDGVLAAVGEVDDYLLKPVAPEALVRAVRAGLERCRLRRENRALLAQLREANTALEARVRERTAALQRERQRLADAQRIARIGSWEWDVAGQVLSASEELWRIYGIDPAAGGADREEFVARLHPDDQELVAGELERAVARGVPFGFDHRVVLPDGALRWVHVEGKVETPRPGAAPRLVGTSQDVTDRKRAEERLAHQALHDALTGLPNRTLLVDRIELALARAARTGRAVAVLFCDLDRFKLVNDSRGHPAGDAILVTVARRLRDALRPSDTVARFGGDEFVVVCEDVDSTEEATLLGERIAHALADPVSVPGGDVFLTASVGIALADGSQPADAVLRDADAAMYRVKETGRDRSEVFDAAMRTEATTRLETRNDLHRAVNRGELRLFYQPIVDLATGAVAGAEALLRWAHPTRGLLTPQSFVTLAEEDGLIVTLGAWALEEACRQAARWPARPESPVLLTVNLSARQLRHPELAETVAATLIRTGLDPTRVCLELTETALMADIDAHTGALLALRALGVTLAIDDFGAGYSSLTYLKRLPVDIVKIDRSFIEGLGRDPSDTAIVRGVVQLAHALGLRVIGEGVEHHQQAETLARLGCDLAQGYHFAAPAPPEALSRLLDDPDLHPPAGTTLPSHAVPSTLTPR